MTKASRSPPSEATGRDRTACRSTAWSATGGGTTAGIETIAVSLAMRYGITRGYRRASGGVLPASRPWRTRTMRGARSPPLGSGASAGPVRTRATVMPTSTGRTGSPGALCWSSVRSRATVAPSRRPLPTTPGSRPRDRQRSATPLPAVQPRTRPVPRRAPLPPGRSRLRRAAPRAAAGSGGGERRRPTRRAESPRRPAGRVGAASQRPIEHPSKRRTQQQEQPSAGGRRGGYVSELASSPRSAAAPRTRSTSASEESA